MLIEQKLRINKEDTNNYQIVVQDDTGFENPYSEKGYRGNILEVEEYFFVVEDLIREQSFKFRKHDTEPIQFGKEVKFIHPEGKFKDSLYRIGMFTKFDIPFEADGFKGLSFISNVVGASTIFKNYGAIIAGDETYVIVSQERDTLFLDRVLEEDVKEFKLGFYDRKEITLYTDLENSIIVATEQIRNCSGSTDKEVRRLAEVQLYLKAVKECVEKGSNEKAKEFLEYATHLIRQGNYFKQIC